MTRPVTHATAVKAKEKGFEGNTGTTAYSLDGVNKISHSSFTYLCYPERYPIDDFDQEELAKWLREEKGIYIGIEVLMMESGSLMFAYTVLQPNIDMNKEWSKDTYFTHDLAYEAGLLNALELV